MVVVLLGVFVERKCRRIGFDPVSVSLPPLPSLDGGNVDLLKDAEIVENVPGPESLVTWNMYMFSGLADGRIVRFSNASNYVTVARSCEAAGACPPLERCVASPWDEAKTEKACGRPLGMRLDGDKIVIADAYVGLLVLSDLGSTKPKLRRILSGATLLNDVAVGRPGQYFVTETTTRHRRRRIFWAALEMRSAGRILTYDESRGVGDVLLDHVYAPNGIEYDAKSNSLIFVSGVSVRRFHLDTGQVSDFIAALPGTGDNVRAMDHLPTGEKKKCYWFGLGSKYAKPFSLLKVFDTVPLARKLMVAFIPYKYLIEIVPKATLLAVYDTGGNLIQTYQDPASQPKVPWLSEAHVYDNHLFLASWYNPFLARIRLDSA